MLKNSNKNIELQNLLDSDDELPTSYNEEPDLPAYLDNQRFDKIKFNWIKKNKVKQIPVKQDTIPAPIQPTSELHHKHNSCFTEQTCTDKKLIKKGILNEQDILCMKSVAAHTKDDLTLLWFIDFLFYKDLQSNYKFLKSCLVFSQEKYKESRNLYSQIFIPKNLSNCFEFVVK